MSLISKLTLSLSGAILSFSTVLVVAPSSFAQAAPAVAPPAAKKEVAVRPEALKLVSFDISKTTAVSVPPKASQIIELEPTYVGFSIYRSGKAQLALTPEILESFDKQKIRALALNKSVSFPQGPELIAQVLFHNLYFCSGNNVPTCDYAILAMDDKNPVQTKIVGSKTWADYNFTETLTLVQKTGLSDGPNTFISETNVFLKAAYFLDVPNKMLTVYWKAMTTKEFTQELKAATDAAAAAAAKIPAPVKPTPLPNTPEPKTPAPLDPPGNSPKSPNTPQSPEPSPAPNPGPAPSPTPPPTVPEVPVTPPPVVNPQPVPPQPVAPIVNPFR